MAGTSAALPRPLLSTIDDGACTEVILFSCTRGQTRVCHLLSHLTHFNEILWNVGLQLRAVDAGKRSGDLVVATVPGTCGDFPLCGVCAQNDELPVSYLRCLLRVHRCIVSAEMNCGVSSSAMVIDALESSSSLRRLTVQGVELHQREARLILPPQASVGCLVSGYVYPGDVRATPVIPRLLERDGGTTLTSLDVAEFAMTSWSIGGLITSLMENETVTELAVGHDIFVWFPGGDPNVFPFERYLTKKNATLKKLTLKSSIALCRVGRLRSLAQAISSMTTLKELYAQWPSTQELCAMFATMVFQSGYLRSVSLLLRDMDDGTDDTPPSGVGEVPRLVSWPSVLQRNRVLRNLDLDASWCSTNHCVRLLNALAQNPASLRTLSLRNLADDGCLQAVCETIRKRGLGRRVCIKDHKVDFGDTSVLPLYPEVTAVTVSSQFLMEDVSVLRNVFETLATCPHVTSLRLLLNSCNSTTFESFATYIKGVVQSAMFESQHNQAPPVLEDNVIRRPLQNVRRVRHSEQPTPFTNCPSSTSVPRELFPRRLVPPFRRNYSLLLLEVPVCLKPDPDMFGAQDVVRRNCGLVERATRFVMGKHDRYGASALEFVSEHPKLVENVRLEAALPGDAEARDKIARGSRLLRRMDLHEFMRMTGVVERRVVCDYREEDDRTQLDKLNVYSWTHVRQYLKLTDVMTDWDPV
ncbi:hypothetical protein MTO96_021554 [Rhipicephalus appendiculatus]